MAQTDARQTARAAAAKTNPNVWIAVEAGDSLTGVVIDVDTAWSDARAIKSDGWYPLLTITREDGTAVRWHAFETVAFSEVMKHQPIPGETITVTYEGEGEVKVKGRNAPKLFRLHVHGRDPKATAARVYGGLKSMREMKVSPPGPDVTIDNDDLPF